MIYTVTFNPSLDYIIHTDNIRLGETNRCTSERLVAGGKGLNISEVLASLEIPSIALGFVSGFTGDEIIRLTEDKGCRSDFIRLKSGFSRINVKLKSTEETEINGIGPDISSDELALLMEKLDMLTENDIVALAGSIPPSLPDTIYRDIIIRLSAKNIPVIVDASKDLLLNVLECRPFLVKPNHYEICEMLKVPFTAQKTEIILYAKRLQSMGARNVLVSMAGEGAVMISESNEIFSCSAPKGTVKNSVGAGDSMVAGFIAGWLESKNYHHAFKLGIAAGSASAFSENLAAKDEIMSIYKTL